MAESRSKKPGRRPIYGRGKMTRKVSVRLSAEQAAAVSSWCARHGCSVLALLRESVLETAGLSRLGNGLPSIRRGARGRGLSGATSMGVPLTAQQDDALRAYAERRGVELASLVRESALKRVGASGLGSLAQAQALSKAVG